MSEINIGQGYTPAEAERGKFAVVNPSTLSAMGYPSAGYGKYAVLTYSMNPNTTVVNLSATTLSVNVCDVAVSNWDALIAETYSGQPLSCDVSVQNWPAAVTAVEVTNWPVSVTAVEVTNWPASVTAVEVTNWPVLVEATTVSSVGLNLSAVLTFNPAITLIELYNNSQNKVYFGYDVSTTFEDLTGKGMILAEDSYYSIEKNISNIVLGSLSGSDVRVFGHRR